jgi:hypothetical protein
MPPLDLAAALIVWLRPQLAVDEKIGAKKPAGQYPTGKYVSVRRGGGIFQWPVVDIPTVQIEAWGPTEASAHDLAQKVRALIWSLHGKMLGSVAQVYRIEEFAGPAWLPDDQASEPRWVWTVSIQHREHMEVA